MGQTIQALVFDCFGVLATDYWEVFLDNLPSIADIDKARETRRAYDNGVIGEAEFNKQIEMATGSQFIGTEGDNSKNAKNHKLLSYIRVLRSRGYKIGILSNVASNWLRESFLDKDEQALFDDFILSYEIGLIKPDPQVFKLTASRLKIPIESIVLIDDKSAYCLAAQQLGMSAVLYKNFNQCQRDLELLLKD